MTEQTTTANPYVGPRTFSYEQRHLFFGREREARDLTARFLSERLLLFYAQSGAGKSSLLQTRIIPQLRNEREFGVLPVARVSGELLPGINKVDNIYAFNLMTSIDDGPDPSRLASVSISDFLARLVFKEGKHWVYDASIVPEPAVEQPRRRYALIVDQFEEIITAHPSRWQEREDFFRQLEDAMVGDPNLWVMLTLREDYVAALDPYANLMTDRLRARFYMERMGVDAALEAVQRPANEAGGRPFAAGVAEKLVDDLRQVRMPGQEKTVSGQHVEPVQLQVVCYQLWEKLKGRPPGPISMDDLAEAGDVDRALAAFYEDAIGRVVGDSTKLTSESALRGWFDANMITEAGTRGSVYQGRRRSADMPNAVIESLADQFLLRRELRAGGAWIELVHDRFVEPIRQSNREWIERQSPLMRAARDWENRGRPPELLLTESQLELAHQEAVDESDPLVVEYLAASEEAVNAVAERLRRQVELEQARLAAAEAEERRQAEEQRALDAESRRKQEAAVSRRLRRQVIFLVLLSLFAATTAVAAGGLYLGRQAALEKSEENYQVAVKNYEAVLAEQAVVATRSAEAIAAQALAEENADLAVQNAAEAMAAQQTAEAERASASQLAANLAKVLTAQAPASTPTETPQPSSLSVVLTLIPGQPPAGVVAALDTILLPTATPSPTPTPNLEATAIVVTAQAQLAQVQATQTVVAEAAPPAQDSGALPFVDGMLISFGSAAGDYLLDDPNDHLSGNTWIPVGTPVTLLERAVGDQTYGSGIWYLVELTDPGDNNQLLTGYLPQEVLAPAASAN